MQAKEDCLICNERCFENNYVSVQKKGLTTLIKASKEREDDKWHVLEERLTDNVEVVVHASCRKNYTRRNSIQAYKKTLKSGPSTSNVTPVKEKLRKSDQVFQFKKRCFLCGHQLDDDILQQDKRKRMKYRKIVHLVEYLDFKDTIVKVGSLRNDEWGKEVCARLANVIDLVAEEGRYHKACHIKFCTSREKKMETKGRPIDEEIQESMKEIYDFLEESEDCQFSVPELIGQIHGYVPSERTIVQKLKDHYKDNIIIASKTKRNAIVCFKGTGHKILNSAWYEEQEKNEEDERLRIVKKAAEIILEDIRSQHFDISAYNNIENFFQDIEETVPPTLMTLLQNIILKGKHGDLNSYQLKCTAISHSIMAATRPRSFLSPLQIGLGSYVHRKFGSKALQTILHKFGFSAPYHEIRRFEASIVLQEEPIILPDSFLQFVFDNADFNINTIDGLNTFHSMGGIMCVTPSSSFTLPKSVPRLRSLPTASDISKKTEVNVNVFERRNFVGKGSIQNLELNDVKPKRLQTIVPFVHDNLWIYAKSEKNSEIRGWNGFMETLTKTSHFEKSAINYLPFLNLPPTHYDTIYSSLCAALEKCKKANQKCCFVTFDQPLYIKAREICAALSDNPDFQNIHIRLGGFHLLMSFLGCIGFIMAGSGLKELLNKVYGTLSVEKLLTGHHFSRAIRGHTLVRLALGKIIANNITVEDDEKAELLKLYNDFIEAPPTLQDVSNNPLFISLTEKFHYELVALEMNGPTARLWCQYFRMVTLVHQFIFAERSGNWVLHLETVRNMLPFFHASGHFPYAKSSHIYLQDMESLKIKMDEKEYDQFTFQGYFTLRRSDKFWSGVWTDMTIEQTLMRSMKTSGGLTHGRGITNSVLGKWIGGGPFVLSITEGLEILCGEYFDSAEQHKDSRDSRSKRDAADVEKLNLWFEKNAPFPVTGECMSISTGIIGNAKTNCYDAYNIGCQALKNICGKKIGEIKLSRQNRIQSLAMTNNSFKVHDHVVTADPMQLFQRILICLKSREDLENYFHYELSPYPLSLFDESGMRKTKKAALYSLFDKKLEDSAPKDSFYIVDGGWLLHRVVWPSTGIFKTVIESYISYVQKHFGTQSIIVFDNYSQNTGETKTFERCRRYSKKICPDVEFLEDMCLTTTQDNFLSNNFNKSRLISFLMEKFCKNNIEVRKAEGDADILIVQTAIEYSTFKKYCTIIGEDIDLLVLLTALAPATNEIFFVKPGRGKMQTTLYSSESLDKKLVLKKNILFLHAFSGCDSTSAIFGKGKIALSNVLEKSEDLLKAAEIFTSAKASHEDVANAGNKVFLGLYGAQKNTESLNMFRFLCFKKSVASGKKRLPALPPTEDSAKLHSLRVYHQVQFWRGNKLPPENWGWNKGPPLTPVKSTVGPAPQEVLNTIFCSCVKGCTKSCGCRKTGLKCSSICVHCSGVSCDNSMTQNIENEDEDDIKVLDKSLCTAQIEESTWENDEDESGGNDEHNNESLPFSEENIFPSNVDMEVHEGIQRAIKRLRFE